MDTHADTELGEGYEESQLAEASDGSDDVSIDRELHDDSDTCDTCRVIPWTAMLKDPMDANIKWPKFSTKKILLQRSTCRICNLFARVFEVQKLPDRGPYYLNRYLYPGFNPCPTSALPMLDPSQETHMLCLRDSTCGLGTAPHLVITNFQPKDTSTEQRYYQTSNIDVDQIKAWVKHCDMTHHLDCAGSTTGELQQLRVIDCHRNTVVSAPRGCRYVALSYVWGQHSSELDELQKPPKTIAHSIYLTQRLGYNYLWIDRYVCRRCLLPAARLLISTVYQPSR
jgi:hypothetical protein